jgi:hypothetical protein
LSKQKASIKYIYIRLHEATSQTTVTLLLAGYFLGLLFDPEEGSSAFSKILKFACTSIGLYGLTLQKILVFMVAAVTASDHHKVEV